MRRLVGQDQGELIVAQMTAAESAMLVGGTAVRVSLLPAPVFAVAD